MEFDYYFERSPLAILDVEDIGNCCIEANNDEGYFWYLIINTKLGKTEISTIGPVIPDISVLLDSVNFDFERFDFNQKKINKIINTFLNTTKKGTTVITQAKLVDKEVAIVELQKLINYLNSGE